MTGRLKAFNRDLIELDPKADHVDMWVEEWTDEEWEHHKQDSRFLPRRFQVHHPTLQFSGDYIVGGVSGG